jgi:TRAP-type C4-dicarboxylate transport system permease small subunit
MERAVSKVAEFLSLLCERLSAVSKGLLVLLGAAMSVIVLLQVIFRFVIHVPFPWSEEIARYMMIWMGMVGAFLALRHGRHIGVSIFVDRLPPSWKAMVTILVQVVTMGFLCIVVRYGMALAIFNRTQLSPAMQIPMIIPYMAIPVGAALMILELLRGILEDLMHMREGPKRSLTSATLEG